MNLYNRPPEATRMSLEKMRSQVQKRIFEKPRSRRLSAQVQAPEFSCLSTEWIEISGFSDWQRRFFNTLTSQAGHLEMRNGRRGPQWVIVPS